MENSGVNETQMTFLKQFITKQTLLQTKITFEINLYN